jgi:hypothetical protein
MIFLIVVEVRRHQAGIVLAGGGFERPQIRAVGLAALVNGDVPKVWSCLFDCVHQIAQERDVGQATLGRCLSLDIGAKDGMGHVFQGAEALSGFHRIE